jgi:hypothetical protein
MTILILEDQYEKLLQASRERHADSPKPYIKGNIFDFNGDSVSYSIVNRKDNTIYANYTYKGDRHIVHIMNDLDFVRLSKKEQRSAAQNKIQKHIEKKTQIKEHLIPGEDYGIDEQIDYLENYKKSLFLYSNVSRSLKLVNNIIHNLKQIRNSQ